MALSPVADTGVTIPGLELRCIERDGAPWFVAADVCRALGMDISTGTGRWTEWLAPTEKATESRRASEFPMIFTGTASRVSVISESGLYTLVMRSRKPEAQQFRTWVTSEVLPAIRKNGGYMTPEVAKLATEDPAVFMARALVSSPP